MSNDRLRQFIGVRGMTVVDAMEMIDKNASGVLFITDEKGKLVGCLTDGDIRRWLLKTGDLSANVSNAMTTSPISVDRTESHCAINVMKERKVTAVPIVDVDGVVVDVLLLRDLEMSGTCRCKPSLKGVDVVIMAGGKGTRLYPYTKILPKPLIPIGDTPIVERVMDIYTEYGITKFYMTVNYRKEMLRSYFTDGEFPFEVKYVEENKPLGTGGSLKLIDDKFDKPLFVTNCDSLILADYDKIYSYHVSSGNAITMVSAVKNITIPYGVIHTKENGELVGMEEKPKISYMINTGMYIVNPDTIDLIPDDTLFHMTHLVEKVRELGGKVGVYPVSEDSFLDMGEFDEMRRMEEKLSIKN